VDIGESRNNNTRRSLQEFDTVSWKLGKSLQRAPEPHPRSLGRQCSGVVDQPPDYSIIIIALNLDNILVIPVIIRRYFIILLQAFRYHYGARNWEGARVICSITK
jgi:hypothetical protein